MAAKNLDTTGRGADSPTVGSAGLGLVGCGSVPGARWYAVRYNPGEERLARSAITRLGYPTFFPLVRQSIPDKRLGRRLTISAAFPGYLFASWSAGSLWQRILSQPGVAGVLHAVGQRDAPIPVPREEFAALEARAVEGGILSDSSLAPSPGPISGAVRVTRGPLAGRVGLAGRNAGDRVAVLLEIMGCNRVASMPRQDLEAVTPGYPVRAMGKAE